MKVLLLGAGRAPGAVAVSDGGRWVLLNAPPDLERQMQRHPRLAADALAGVVLMDAHFDRAAGLMALRDGPPIELHATPAVFEELTTGLPLLQVLDRCCGVHWHLMAVAGEQATAQFRIEGVPALCFTAIATAQEVPGERVALQVEDLRDGRRLLYWPGPPPLPPDLDADLVLCAGELPGAGAADAPAANHGMEIEL